MATEAGRLLNQRYRLIRPVGQGSQASVWVAEHLALQTHVAVKLIDPELAKKETARERFRREATAAAQLRSTHVVQILDHGIDGDQPYIVMELLDGEDLFERLAHRGRLSLRETSKIVTQVARALSRAHAAGIIHRDLKPENVFLCPNEDDEIVKVLDFGVAKVKDAKVTMQKTGVGTLIGTPHYMSPEQVKGITEVDYRTDLWALGVIAFQCVTGELPFDSEGVGDLLIKISIGEAPIPSRVYPGVAVNFDAWFAKACDRDPNKRFQSARELAVALAGVVGVVDGVVSRAPTMRPPAAPRPKSVPAPPLVASGVAPAAAAGELEWEEVDPFVDDEPEPPKRAALVTSPGLAPPPGLTPPRPSASRPPLSSRASHASARLPAPGPRAFVSRVTPPSTPRLGLPPGEVAKPALRVELNESHDIDFDETIPADGLPEVGFPLKVRAEPASASAAALAPLSEPPRPAAGPQANPFLEGVYEGAPQGRPQLVVAPPGPVHFGPPPPRVVLAPPPVVDPLAPVIPRPPRTPGSQPIAQATPAPVVRPLGIAPPISPMTGPPPEIDGASKRRRMVRVLVAGLVVLAVGLAFTVVRSQLNAMSTVSATPSATATVEPPSPPPLPPSKPAPSEVVVPTASAVVPGKVTHPTKPGYPGVRKPLPPKPRPQPHDGTIIIPDPPPDDGLPPAP